MKLVICEKPSVGAAVAAALGVTGRKDGYIEGNGYLISWCIGHLVQLSEAAAYGEQYKKWSYTRQWQSCEDTPPYSGWVSASFFQELNPVLLPLL